MQLEIIIGIAIAVTVAVTLGVKTWLGALLKFKMDESAIVNYLTEANDDHALPSTEAISLATDLDPARVSRVCTKSTLIKRNGKEDELWCLQRP